MDSIIESLNLGLRPSYAAATDSDNLSPSPCPHFLPPSHNSFVTFRHPGYPGPGNILCRLPMYDGTSTSSNTVGRLCGIHHGTALQACSIIACNTIGFLSPTILDANAQPQPAENWDALLTAKVYYFYSRAWITSRDQSDLVYPVCPSFQDWHFPHNLLPQEWVSAYTSNEPVQRIPTPSQYSAAALLRDGSCRVTNFDDCTETAHLVPKREYAWFTRNEMEVYNRNTKLTSNLMTSDIENLLFLRTDIHMQLDSGNLVFVPKAGTSRVHFLTETRQYGPMLHNRATEQFRIAPEFLYARFAWAVLPLAQAFAEKPGVKIRVWSAKQATWEDKVNPTEEPGPPRKRPRLENRGSKGVADRSASKDSSADTSLQDRGSHHHPSTPPSHQSSPSPTWTPRAGYERRRMIFDGIVSRDPASAWESLHWHPDAERLEVMKDAYLKAHEPLHDKEMQRQMAILMRGHAVYDDETLYDEQNAVDSIVEDESE